MDAFLAGRQSGVGIMSPVLSPTGETGGAGAGGGGCDNADAGSLPFLTSAFAML